MHAGSPATSTACGKGARSSPRARRSATGGRSRSAACPTTSTSSRRPAPVAAPPSPSRSIRRRRSSFVGRPPTRGCSRTASRDGCARRHGATSSSGSLLDPGRWVSHPHAITVRDQRTRWGSASRQGTLSFSWRLVLAPPEILDYVVVHELAHLRWAGHGTRFWSLVRRFAPAADHHRRWLRQNEARLRHALD